MIEIAICDDERYYVNKIEKMLAAILRQHKISAFHIDTFLSGVELCKDADKVKNYKIVFLDINMSQMDGIKTAEIVRKTNKDAYLVFITAYADYAVEGYMVDAVRYLLKDMLDIMLQECVETILHRLNLKGHKVKYSFIEGERELQADKICYVESESKKHRVAFHMFGTAMVQFHLYGKLDDIENDLADYGFIRIHKSYLVNIKYIQELGNYKAKLKTGDWLPIPREKYRFVKERYFEMMGEL